jgi:hypothetical protein
MRRVHLERAIVISTCDCVRNAVVTRRISSRVLKGVYPRAPATLPYQACLLTTSGRPPVDFASKELGATGWPWLLDGMMQFISSEQTGRSTYSGWAP